MMDPHLGVFLPGENGLGFDKTLQEAGRRSTLHPLLPQASSAHRGGDDGAGDTVVLTEPQMQDGTSTLSDEESVAPAYFPPLSLSDHPITSLPCISLHPCQTAVVIGEMMHSREVSGGQDGNGGQEEAVYAKEYLKAFMTICASVVEMRG
ncbi:hypothetical protein BCV69DRAFT_282547 [Microstroma glucosiphilum]|uniref:Uncharacterized protein n=1 Tax=Pseudomicrostroma glucosiphilum TaxID=1684307 RepID=A0A316UDA8_9BASI|nr:hypothetical protein BCV69DRAFT_282547 [Pseudomicrostroma glucosiphilum]PWN21045.1 hypothetical protein BCV69DRAFT_282547 [Pseudomicrostroma glucosiphilum]